MNGSGPIVKPETIPTNLAKWMVDNDDPSISLLTAIGDAGELRCKFEPTSDDTVKIFTHWWPEARLEETTTQLLAEGLIEADSDRSFALPSRLQPTLKASLTEFYSHDSSFFNDIFDGFSRYLQQEQPEVVPADPSIDLWNGRTYLTGERRHHLIYRSFPLLFEAPPEDYLLVISEYPDTVLEKIIENFVADASRRNRVAILDLDQTQKVNLTRSEVFVHFERYLRRAHGLRIRTVPTLSRALADGAILNLEMG
ncbi:MAG: hypothetical protein HQK55_02390 [Deltaproteobacteria bacterium]|nr:hypothetical protein [Deltaproteobacteria bacterium]